MTRRFFNELREYVSLTRSRDFEERERGKERRGREENILSLELHAYRFYFLFRLRILLTLASCSSSLSFRRERRLACYAATTLLIVIAEIKRDAEIVRACREERYV